MSQPCKGNLGKLIALMDGNLSARATDRLRGHMGRCSRCADAYRRISATHKRCAEINDEEPADVGWRRIDTQVNWHISRPERQERRGERPRLVLAMAAVAVAGIVLGFVLPGSLGWPPPETKVVRHELPILVPQVVQQPAPAAPDRQLVALATLIKGKVFLQRGGAERQALDASRLVVTGDRLITEQGELALQWEAGTGLRLGRQSAGQLSSLSERNQVFQLDQGKAELQVKARRAEQHLAVVTDDLTVSVRGTRFAVTRSEQGTSVEVFKGKVLVEPVNRAWSGMEVVAGYQVTVAAGSTVAPRLVKISHALADDRLHLVPWEGLADVLQGSAMLPVDSRRGRDLELRLDGQAVGTTPLALRAPHGRHVLALYHGGKLVESRALEFSATMAPVTLGNQPPRPDPLPQLSPRRQASFSRISREKGRSLRPCYERQLKRNETLAGFVEVGIEVGRSGDVTAVNVLQRTLSSEAAVRCIKREIMRWRYPPLESEDSLELVVKFAFQPPPKVPVP